MSPTSAEIALQSRLWDAKDVARYVNASVSWVYKVAEAGLLPCLRIGSMLRFDPASVRAFVRDPNAKGVQAKRA